MVRNRASVSSFMKQHCGRPHYVGWVANVRRSDGGHLGSPTTAMGRRESNLAAEDAISSIQQLFLEPITPRAMILAQIVRVH